MGTGAAGSVIVAAAAIWCRGSVVESGDLKVRFLSIFNR